MAEVKQIDETYNVLFFYKGSTIPSACVGSSEEQTVMKLAKEMIAQGLRDGESLEQQKADYVQQLDKLEQALFNSQKAGFMKHEMYKEACKSVDKMEDTFHALWSLNICALIILKVIKDDDDMNGVMRLMPTELREWLKDQMRAIENQTLEPDKAMMILDMLNEWKHTGHSYECCQIIDELKAEKKNIFFECNEKPMCDDKALKSKMIDLDMPTFDDTEQSKLICANSCMKNCNHIQAWFVCGHTMCIESARHCGYCIECGEKKRKK